MTDKLSDRELLELFASLLKEAEKPHPEKAQFDVLKKKLRDNLGDFPSRFADGAEKLLQSLETTKISS